MLVFYITVPLMVAAVLVATVPVLRGSLRHDRDMRQGDLESAETADHEVDFWHRLLGRRGSGPTELVTPGLVDDSEVIRVGVEPRDARETRSGESIVKRSS